MVSRRSLTLGSIFAVSLLTSASVYAGPNVLIDFETVPTGPLAANGLAAYGVSSITAVDAVPNTLGADYVGVRNMSDVPDLTLSSPVNAFQPAGSFFPHNGVSTTTLVFIGGGLNSFSFTKAGENDLTPDYGFAGWRAEAYDASNNLVDFEEDGYGSGLDFPNPIVLTYTLSGSAAIKTVLIKTNYTGQSSAGTVWLDDFRMDFVPEPTSMLTLAAAGMMVRRRR